MARSRLSSDRDRRSLQRPDARVLMYQNRSNFSPLSLSPSLWLRGDLGITLNGNDVSAWADQSGNNNHATQSTAGNQPLYVSGAAAFANKPVVRFSVANSDHLIADTLGNLLSGTDKPYTVIMVAKQTSASNYILWSFGNSLVAAGGTCIQMYNELSANSCRVDKVDDLSTASRVSKTSSLTGTAKMQMVAHSGTSFFVRNNATETTSSAQDVGATTLDLFTIGCFRGSNSVEFWDGDLAEALVFNRELVLPERDAVWNYVKNRYAL